MNKMIWIALSYILGIASMFMSMKTFNIYAIISILFYAILQISYKSKIEPILHASILASISSILFHWWMGHSFGFILMALMSILPALAVALERGEILYEKKQIKAIFYMKQMGVSFMLPLVMGIIFSLCTGNDFYAFTLFALGYAGMMICVRLMRQFTVYNVLFIILQVVVWGYISTFMGDVNLSIKIGFGLAIVAAYVLKIQFGGRRNVA